MRLIIMAPLIEGLLIEKLGGRAWGCGVIRVSLSEPHTKHHYKKLAVPM